MPATEAARRAGYSGRNPAQSAYQASRNIRERIQHALFEARLTPEGLVHKYLFPALKAEETEFCKLNGKITDSRNVPAWGIPLRSIELVAELSGYMAPKSHDVVGKVGEICYPKVIGVLGMRSRSMSERTKENSFG